jgi:hypothetical protein
MAARHLLSLRAIRNLDYCGAGDNLCLFRPRIFNSAQAMSTGSQNFQKRGLLRHRVIDQRTAPTANGAAPIANAASRWNQRAGFPAKGQPGGPTVVAARAKTTADKTGYLILAGRHCVIRSSATAAIALFESNYETEIN